MREGDRVSLSSIPEFLSFDSCRREGRKGEGWSWRLITAETIPDQTSVSNCPANRKEPDKQRNRWVNSEVVNLGESIKFYR